MWIDLDFLNENIFLKKVSPNLEITHNPLLLDRKNLHRNIIDLRERFPTEINGSLVLSSLKGDTEQVKQNIYINVSVFSLICCSYDKCRDTRKVEC